MMNSSETATGLRLFGIDHHLASTAVRERVHLDGERIRLFQEAFATEPCGVGSIVLCTCNRTEIYLEVQGGCRGRSALRRGLAAAGIDAGLFLGEHGRQLSELDVARHLFRVCAGLESMVLGEGQIAGQVRGAYRLAEQHGALSPLLMRTFQAAFRTGKRVRTETALGQGTASVALAAVEEACRRLDDLATRHALLIGAGKIGSLAARHLLRRGVGHLTVLNRSLRRAEAVAGELQPTAVQELGILGLAQLREGLAAADLVLTATGSPTPLLERDLLADVLAGRAARPLLVFDLAVPRDVEPAATLLAGLTVLGLDDLSGLEQSDLAARAAEVDHADRIVQEELGEHERWLGDRQLQPAILGLRSYLETLKAREMDRIRRQAPPDMAAVVERTLDGFIRKLLQRPVVQLRANSSPAERCQDADCLQRLFRLETAEREV